MLGHNKVRKIQFISQNCRIQVGNRNEVRKINFGEPPKHQLIVTDSTLSFLLHQASLKRCLHLHLAPYNQAPVPIALLFHTITSLQVSLVARSLGLCSFPGVAPSLTSTSLPEHFPYFLWLQGVSAVSSHSASFFPSPHCGLSLSSCIWSSSFLYTCPLSPDSVDDLYEPHSL